MCFWLFWPRFSVSGWSGARNQQKYLNSGQEARDDKVGVLSVVETFKAPTCGRRKWFPCRKNPVILRHFFFYYKSWSLAGVVFRCIILSINTTFWFWPCGLSKLYRNCVESNVQRLVCWCRAIPFWHRKFEDMVLVKNSFEFEKASTECRENWAKTLTEYSNIWICKHQSNVRVPVVHVVVSVKIL